MLSITISKSGQPANTINFDKREITIGRTPSNDVRIPEPGVSSSHARILYTDGSLTLIDLDSTNGTFVNGQRIQGPQMVQPGDDVYVCSHKLGFALDGASAAPSAPAPPGPGGPLPVGMGAPMPVGVGAPPAPMGGPPLPVGVSGGPPMGGPPLPVGVSGGPPMGGPPLPVGVSGGPPVGGPPLPVGVSGSPPPMGGPPSPGPGGAPPPIPGPLAAPPPIPGPAPRPDPSMPPPLGGPGPGSAPPVLAVPSAAGVGGPVPGKAPGEPPTMPPMMPGGAPPPAPPVSAPPSVPPPPSAAPPSMDGPAPMDEPPSMEPPSAMDAPPTMEPPPPMAAPPSVDAPPTMDGPATVDDEAEPPAMDGPPPDGPPPSLSAPEPMDAPSAIDPPGPPTPVAEPEPPGPPPPVSQPEPPGPPPPVAAPPTPEPTPPAASMPQMPGPPPPQPRDGSKPQTPSTAAPGMAGKIETPTTGPDMTKDGPPKKVVIGSQSPVRTGATMMADALSREDYPAPDSPGAAAVASWVAPAVSAAAPPPGAPRPGALQGLDSDEKTTEACTQVFAAAVASLTERPAQGEDDVRAQLRNGLQDFAAHAPDLDVQGLAARMFDELRGRGPLGPLLADPQVHEIGLRGPSAATVTKAGQHSEAQVQFTSPDAMAWVLSHLVGRPFDPARPVLEGSSPDGIRLSAVHHSIAADGPVARLRKSGGAPPRHELAQLVASGTLSDPCAKLLASAVAAGLRLLIVGGPGARTGPLLNALTFLSPGERTVVVRPGHEHAAVPPGVTLLQSARPEAMASLVDGALTLQPQRLVVHGICGAEAAVAVSALGRGLEGAILSLQASDCMSGLHRLATLAAGAGRGVDAQTQLQSVCQVVDVVVALGRFGDGRTRVTQVAQPRTSPTSAPAVTDLITLDPASRGWTPTAALAAFTAGLQSRGFGS